MFTFDNTHIFTGYLKQYLSSFNLPKYRVYTAENEKYHREHISERKNEKDIFKTVFKNTDNETYHKDTKYIEYIKDGFIQYCVEENGSYKWIKYDNRPYVYNRLDLNHTKRLVLSSNVYDTYTHEYLGDFLRFQRDYNHVDLMPLYNCFNNKIVNHLNLEFDKTYFETENFVSSDAISNNPTVYNVSFKSSDTNYKIYMLPVKLFHEYTIAIDSPNVIEMCCGFFGEYLDEREKFKPFSQATYVKYKSMNFNQPVIFDKLLSENLSKEIKRLTNNGDYINTELALMEKDLKLFIKVPHDLNSTITILEGNYIGWNDSFYSKRDNKDFKFIQNKFVTNYQNYSDDQKFVPITRLQLLSLNTKVSYPFADKLLEYLAGNVITNLDTIEDNIKRVETVLALNGNPIQRDSDGNPLGLWTDRYRRTVYDKLTDVTSIEHLDQNKNKSNLSETNLETLGFVDKVAEKNYTYSYTNEDGKTVLTSIAGVDIYSE